METGEAKTHCLKSPSLAERQVSFAKSALSDVNLHK